MSLMKLGSMPIATSGEPEANLVMIAQALSAPNPRFTQELKKTAGAVQELATTIEGNAKKEDERIAVLEQRLDVLSETVRRLERFQTEEKNALLERIDRLERVVMGNPAPIPPLSPSTTPSQQNNAVDRLTKLKKSLEGSS